MKSRLGGKREGAGRPRKQFLPDGTPTEPHTARPVFDTRSVLKISLFAVPVVGPLRSLDRYAACRIAQRSVISRADFGLLHYSIQDSHVHLIVEADSTLALTNGIRAFRISLTKQWNRLMSRPRGPVFADRYHSRLLTTPPEMRDAIREVLNSWLQHDGARGYFADLAVDPYSSGAEFLGWQELDGTQQYWRAEGFEPPMLAEPRTWLASAGWRKAGPLSVRSAPASDP